MREPGDESALDWDQASAALASTRPWLTPAELHGLLCGSVCADGVGPGDDGWLQRIFEHLGEDLVDGADHRELLRFRALAVAGLEAEDLSFALLLPDDAAPLGERVGALAAWCAGFLSGYGLGRGATEGLEEDALDALRDLANIAAVDADVDGGEAEEQDFAELQEFVRMGALVILAAVRARDADARTQDGIQ